MSTRRLLLAACLVPAYAVGASSASGQAPDRATGEKPDQRHDRGWTIPGRDPRVAPPLRGAELVARRHLPVAELRRAALAAAGRRGRAAAIQTGAVKGINNDHGISPDGKTLAISARADLRRCRPKGGSRSRSPQGPRATSTAGRPTARRSPTAPSGATISTSTPSPPTAATRRRLTTHAGYDDGPDYSPDGSWIYFNSDRSGNWDIWRIPADGAGPDDAKAERITNDELGGLVPAPLAGRQVAGLPLLPQGDEGPPGEPGRRPPRACRCPATGQAPTIRGGRPALRRAGDDQRQLLVARRQEVRLRQLPAPTLERRRRSSNQRSELTSAGRVKSPAVQEDVSRRSCFSETLFIPDASNRGRRMRLSQAFVTPLSSGLAHRDGRCRIGPGSAGERCRVGARDRGRPRHQDRDRQARSRHSQEEPQAVDDRHREGIVSRQGDGLPRNRRRADGRRLAHGGGQRRSLERSGLRPGRAWRRPLYLVHERDRSGEAILRPDGPRQQPSQADGRGAAALPPDEARPARDHPRQGFRRGEDDLQVRVCRPRPQARIAVDATDRVSPRASGISS